MTRQWPALGTVIEAFMAAGDRFKRHAARVSRTGSYG